MAGTPRSERRTNIALQALLDRYEPRTLADYENGIPRFSEDMTSLLAPPAGLALEPYVEAIRRELASFGFSFRVERRSKRVSTAVESAFIKGGTRVTLAHAGMPDFETR